MLSYKLNPNFQELEDILPQINDLFATSGTTIYKIRNEIKILEINHCPLKN